MKQPPRPLTETQKTVIALAVVLFILFCPFSVIRYKDGGTTRVQALTYCVMRWNIAQSTVDQDGNPIPADPYQKTTLTFFPSCYKDYDALRALALDEKE